MAFSLRQLAYSGFTVAMMAYAGQAHASTGHNDVCIPGSMIGVSGQTSGMTLAACRTPEGYKLWNMDGKGRNAGTFGLRLDGQGRVISAYDVLPQGNAALHVHGTKMTMVLLPKEHMKNSGKMAAAFGNAVVDARQEAKSLYGAAFSPISYNVKIETIQPSPLVAKPVPHAAKPAVAVEQHKPVAAPVVLPVVPVVAQKPAIKPVAPAVVVSNNSVQATPAAVAPVKTVNSEVNLGLGDNPVGAPALTAANPFKGAALMKPITANPEDRIKLSTQSGISIADLIAAMGLTGLFAFAAGVATSRRVKDGLRAAKNKMVAGGNAVKNGARHIATEVIAKNAVNGALHAYEAYANSKVAAASVVNKASSSVSAGVQTAKDNAGKVQDKVVTHASVVAGHASVAAGRAGEAINSVKESFAAGWTFMMSPIENAKMRAEEARRQARIEEVRSRYGVKKRPAPVTPKRVVGRTKLKARTQPRF